MQFQLWLTLAIGSCALVGSCVCTEGVTEDSATKIPVVGPETTESRIPVVGPETTDPQTIIEYLEARLKIPPGLLGAIARVESLHRPWAVNAGRTSRYFKTSQQAVEYVAGLERQRVKNISIGFMQINWNVHKSKFSDLNEAFAPYYNIRFAAILLKSLYHRFGSWEKAIGWYNPKGRKQNDVYLRKVLRYWAPK